MINKETIKQIIIENQQLINGLEVFVRGKTLEPKGNYVFTGARRAGKTYTMFQSIKMKLAQGVSISSVLYINFEDERLTELQGEHLNLLIESHAELFAIKPILYLDEIQIIKGWEKFARRMADSGYRIYVTGSNAQMLSSEIATILGGRFLIKEIFPFSFKEYLAINQISIEKNWEYSSQRFEIRQLFNNYFYFGGFPEINRFTEKRIWLQNLYKKIFFGDLVARYKIRNDFALKLVIKKLAESVHDGISFNRIKHVIQSTGTKIGTATIIDYVKFLKETWLLFGIKNYLAKLNEKESTGKYYFIDNGILSLFLINPETILLENLVAIQLMRKFGNEVYFLKKNVEVDFYIPAEQLMIQVAYNIQNAETERRELNAMRIMSKFVPVKNRLIITLDTEKQIEDNNDKIEVVPVWKWLLSF
jgi:predicted AAA+ superfamily ATPase